MHDATVQLVKKYFPDIEFTAVFGQRDGFPIKPDPEILDTIINNAGIEKNEILYVGDSGVDVMTALNAKVPFMGVLWGFRPRKELEELGAKQFAETTKDILDFIVKNNL